MGWSPMLVIGRMIFERAKNEIASYVMPVGSIRIK